jgi:hypothetical protein
MRTTWFSTLEKYNTLILKRFGFSTPNPKPTATTTPPENWLNTKCAPYLSL